MAHYKGGVLSWSNCSEGTNHGVLAVGYGTCPGGSDTTGPCANVTAKTDYCPRPFPLLPAVLLVADAGARGAGKVKNSWGTKFGVEGYFYLVRGAYPSGCGTASTLLTNPSYPVMAKRP